MSTENIMLAGPGLLRSGNVLSVNPELRLRALHIRNKITVPEPTNNDHACSKSYVDVLVSTSKPQIGDGLVMIDDVLQVSRTPIFSSVTVTDIPSTDNSCVTKKYVEDVTRDHVTVNNMETRVSDFIKTNDVVEMVKDYATRSYVESCITTFAKEEDIVARLEPLAKTEYVDTTLRNYASLYHVESETQNLVSRSELIPLVESFAKKLDVSIAMENFVDKSYIDTLLFNIDHQHRTLIEESVDTAVQPLLSKAELLQTVESLTTKEELKNATATLATKSYVNDMVGSLADEAYVDSVVENLVNKQYVDNALLPMATKKYVDYEISRGTYGIQNVIASDGMMVQSSGKNYILIQDSATNVTVSFPDSPRNGQIFTIAFSGDITNFAFNRGRIINKTFGESISVSKGDKFAFIWSDVGESWWSI